MSFRFKLLIAMMLVVACVSSATLVITSAKVQAAYERVFKEKLEAQITYVPKEQEARLSAVKQKCRELADTVRFQAALAAGDPDQIYLYASDQLQRVLAQDWSADADGTNSAGATSAPPAIPPRREDSPKGPPLRREEWWRGTNLAFPVPPDLARRAMELRKSNAPFPPDLVAKLEEARRKAGLARPVQPPPRPPKAVFFVVLDADGRVMEPTTQRARSFLHFEMRRRFQRQFEGARLDVRQLTAQQVGYFDAEGGRDRPPLMEVVVTPIIDSATREVLGALALAFPFMDTGEETISAVSEIENGLFVEGKLYSRTIPDDVRRELTARLPEEIARHGVPRDDFLINVKGVPHRVFYTPINPGSPLPVAWKVGLYSWEGALNAQRELRLQIIGFGAAGLVLALLVSLFLSHNLSVPIRELVAGTAQVQNGNLGIRVPVRGRDELARLAAAFNEMTRGLALKERYATVLGKVADKDVAQELVSGRLALGGETREVSILFCDIRGFTALTQHMDPAEVIALLNEHMTVMTRVVDAHHGVVDKFIGDSIMAIFGAPKSYGHDPLNAARCALQMIEERRKLNETSTHKIHIGIGIATGPVLAGNMGSEKRLNYTVIGERVNLASRLCGVAGRMEIVIGEHTREALGDAATAEPLPEMRLKGFNESVRAYRLLAVQAPSAVAQPA
jgi:class 3 adenylate cyclase